MRDGNHIKPNEVYLKIKERVPHTAIWEFLKECQKFAEYYKKIIFPNFEEDPTLSKHLAHLKELEAEIAFPMILKMYSAYEEKKLEGKQFVEILSLIENFLVRRFVCNVAMSKLNTLFLVICQSFGEKNPVHWIKIVKDNFEANKYESDEIKFQKAFTKLEYESGAKAAKIKFILKRIEESYEHKEIASFDKATIEHILPQKISPWWKEHLGLNWEEIQKKWGNNIGNLTLTGFNQKLSNDGFDKKKKTYAKSHYELTKQLEQENFWTQKEIRERAKVLAKKASEIWKSFVKNKGESLFKEPKI